MKFYEKIINISRGEVIHCLNICSFKRNMMEYFEILCGAVALLLAFYNYSTSAFDFWERCEVPVFLFGNAFDIFTSRLSMPIYVRNLYDKYKNEQMFGIYI